MYVHNGKAYLIFNLDLFVICVRSLTCAGCKPVHISPAAGLTND